MTDTEDKQLTILLIRRLREARLAWLECHEVWLNLRARADYLKAKVETYRCLVDEAKWEQQLLNNEGDHHEETSKPLVLIPNAGPFGPVTTS